MNASSHGKRTSSQGRKQASRPGPTKKSGASRPPASGAPRRAESQRSRQRLRRRTPAWLITVAASLVVTLFTCAGLLWWWGRSGESAGTNVAKAQHRDVQLGSEQANSGLFDVLGAAGLVANPSLMSFYQRVWHPWFEAEEGTHWVQVGLAPGELLEVVGRSRRRAVVKVTLPEGWDSFQMAERLAAAGVCGRQAFLDEVFVGPSAPDDLRETELPWSSFEGQLYPASYEFRVNARASDVVARLVAEAGKRHQATFARHQPALQRLQQTLRLTTQDVVTLASIVEKEAANEAELPLVASVFLNRLRDVNFRPLKMLQSDPTAGYGCKREPSLNSCRGFTGKVTAAMLRDSENAFNTYRHPGLPPTAIGNPSTRAIEAVLTAPPTDYLFFVSPDGGPHRFSRTLAEHERHLR